MKISNLSLAILIALGTAACGGSGSSDNKPADPPKPGNPNTPAPQAPDTSALPKVVDPTQTQVVDQKDLSKVESVGTLQYIRRDGSNYDKSFNPSQPASASPFLGVHLDDQNPRLTNIVLARQNLQRSDGKPVKAQFAGGTSQDPLKASTGEIQNGEVKGLNLQAENFKHVDVLGGAFKTLTGADIADSKTNPFTKDTKWQKNDFRRGTPTTAGEIAAQAVRQDKFKPLVWNKEKNEYEVVTDAIAKAVTGNSNATAPVDTVTAMRTYVNNHKATDTDKAKYDGYLEYVQQNTTTGSDFKGVVTTTEAALGRRFGKHLVWWSSPDTAFENDATRGKADAKTTGADATTGLIRIGGGDRTLGEELVWNKDDKKWVDHHNTTTRIFGRYHLAYAANNKIAPVTLNTFVGAASFVSEVQDRGSDGAPTLTDKAKSYSIGAVPGHLENVQYGRVTTQLDVEMGEGPYGDGFLWQPYARKNAEDSVDNYFYRGTNATTIAEMAALPTDKKLVYHGHALMYGIDNSYHGGGAKNLPNAFAPGGNEGQLGLGNFVEATADLATKKLTGTVYNAWLLDQSKAEVMKDKLVTFEGNIVGNSAFGSADRAYIAGEDKADFRASFFGDKAEELGGSFNSVHSIPSNGTAQAYGSAYGAGDWGGVFGAKQAGSGNTFQGDDGANVYTGLGN